MALRKKAPSTVLNWRLFVSTKLFGRKLAYCNLHSAVLLTILGGSLFALKLTLSSRASSKLFYSVSYAVDARPSCDWWDCPEKLPAGQRVFNKSILYLKPHKTGSETFKKLLLRVGEYYDLTTDDEKRRPRGARNKEQKPLLNITHDILLRHSRYQKGVTEKRIRGWSESSLGSQERNSTTQRELIRIVSIRNPIDRLFSHYFSQRRFKTFTPKRGGLPPGVLSEEEEIADFLEWLAQYKQSHQIFYNRDTGAWGDRREDGEEILAGIDEVVDFYDHIIVADQWKLSICLFGLIERIHPSLMVLESRNVSGPRARRFRKTKVLANRALYKKVLEKIDYDFLLYNALMKKFNERLLSVENSELGRYCDKVDALSKEEFEHI